MDYLSFFIKFLFMFCLSSLFLSCDRLKPEEVTSGVAQGQQLVFSKQCVSGSIQIFKQTTVATGTGAQPLGTGTQPLTGSVYDPSQLNVGDKVNIQGQVSNGPACYPGVISFTCSARVVQDQNRAFACEQGTVQGGYSTGSSYGATTAPTAGHVPPGGAYTHGGTPVLGGQAILQGQIIVRGNGQAVRAFFNIGPTSQSLSHIPQAACMIGLFCG